MLSKQQAKVFFLGGTFLFLAIFIGMSVHSLAIGIPEQTNDSDISDDVKLGKQLWDENNCMGCHTLMGEGAYYAPELTRVYERKGPEYIRAVLNAPNGWAPRGRQMVKYELTEEEVNGLIAFFEWMNRADLNGFPPEPSLGK